MVFDDYQFCKEREKIDTPPRRAYHAGDGRVFGYPQKSAKAVVIRDASTVSSTNGGLSIDRMALEGLDRLAGATAAVIQNDGDSVAEQTAVLEQGSFSAGIYIDFATLGSILGEWQPSDPGIARVTVVSELVGVLRAKRIQAQTGRGPDILVCDRYPVDLERGNKPSDVDRLLEKMIWDSHIYGCVVGVAYGVQDQTISEQLECVLEEFFDKEDMATIVLC